MNVAALSFLPGEREMKKCGAAVRLLSVMAIAVLVFGSQGCTSAQKYVQYRVEDAAEMIDLGFTITETPQVGLY